MITISSVLSDHKNRICFGISLLKKWTQRLYFHLPSNFVYMNSGKGSGCPDAFFCKTTDNNDSSENKRSAVYY